MQPPHAKRLRTTPLHSLATGAPTLRIACLGDSNTSGYNLSKSDVGDSERLSYPTVLHRLLQERYGARYAIRVGHFGRCGATLVPGTLEYTSLKRRFPEAIRYEAHVAVLMFGTNDAVTGTSMITFRACLLAFVQYIHSTLRPHQAFLKAPIILVYPPGQKHNVKTLVHPEVRAVAEQANCLGIQCLLAKPQFSHDCFQDDVVHLTVRGCKILAEVVAQLVSGLLRPDASCGHGQGFDRPAQEQVAQTE